MAFFVVFFLGHFFTGVAQQNGQRPQFGIKPALIATGKAAWGLVGLVPIAVGEWAQAPYSVFLDYLGYMSGGAVHHEINARSLKPRQAWLRGKAKKEGWTSRRSFVKAVAVGSTIASMGISVRTLLMASRPTISKQIIEEPVRADPEGLVAAFEKTARLLQSSGYEHMEVVWDYINFIRDPNNVDVELAKTSDAPWGKGKHPNGKTVVTLNPEFLADLMNAIGQRGSPDLWWEYVASGLVREAWGLALVRSPVRREDSLTTAEDAIIDVHAVEFFEMKTVADFLVWSSAKNLFSFSAAADATRKRIDPFLKRP